MTWRSARKDAARQTARSETRFVTIVALGGPLLLAAVLVLSRYWR